MLDLFAGSGSLGLEALSEGAERCDFVEKSYKVYKILEKNISNLGFEALAHVHICSAISYLNNCNQTFDLIFLDPPYARQLAIKIIDSIYQNDLLNTDGLIIAETGKEEDVSKFNDMIIREKMYGDTKVVILKKGTV